MSDYIPPELITQILLNLPVKSLLRFKCVCKDWCLQISNPSFVTKHYSKTLLKRATKTLVRHYSKTHSKEIYRVYNDECFNVENSVRISFPFHERSNYYFRIVGYCNGVLCLSDDFFKYKESVILWNPSVKRAVMVPTPRVIYDRYGSCFFALGFGFDNVSDDFKVVRVAYVLNDRQKERFVAPRVEVFCVSTNVWRRVKNGVECYISEFWTQAFFRGAAHWCAYKKTRSRNDDGYYYRNLILRFDLGSEKFDELGLPEELASVPPVNICVTTVRGRFGVLYTNYFLTELIEDLPGSCAVFVMMDYENAESWTRVFSVQLGKGLSMMLGFKRDNDILFSAESGELVSQNFDSETVTGTGILGTKYSFFVDKYVESLFLLDKGRVFRGKDPELDYEDEDETVEKAEYTNKFLALSLNTLTVKDFDA